MVKKTEFQVTEKILENELSPSIFQSDGVGRARTRAEVLAPFSMYSTHCLSVPGLVLGAGK